MTADLGSQKQMENKCILDQGSYPFRRFKWPALILLRRLNLFDTHFIWKGPLVDEQPVRFYRGTHYDFTFLWPEVVLVLYLNAIVYF